MMRKMRAPCEIMSKYVLPSVRSIIVNYLYEEVGLSQLEIARKLKISQSTVSRYVNNERGLYKEIISSIPGFSDIMEVIKKEIMKKEGQRENILCITCEFLREKNYTDEILKIIKERNKKLRNI